jgi:dienelactone hydrolase
MLKQLEERRIAQWAIGYLAGSWIALQVFELLWDVFEWPLGPLRVLIGLIGLGFFVALAAAWVRPRKVGAPAPRAGSGKGHGRLVPALSSVLALVLFVGVGFAVKRSLDRSWAGGAAVLEVEALAATQAYGPALEILERALGYLPENPDLLAQLEEVSASPILETIPTGASVYTRDYEGVEEWALVGETPLTGVRVPRRVTRWRIVKDGFAEMEIVGPPGGPTAVRPGAPVPPLTLVESGSVPEDMIPVPGSNGVTFITGIDPLAQRDLSSFFIDRHEVTNEAFQQFVDDGGYERSEFWEEPFVLDGRILSFEQAMERFRDVTGRPGPAGWEVGRYPVGGVSWYEAAAYAEFVGKSLPTIHHWTAAAGPNLAAAVVSGSNFGSAATVPVGQTPSLSAWGASDMAGNVREWLWTASGDMRHNLGGGWSDNTYFFTFANVQSPWDRLPVNGFRLAVYPEGVDLDDPAWAPEPLLSRDYAEEEPVADEIFEVYRAQFDYDPAPLDVRIEREVELSYGTGQLVSYGGVGWGRIQAVVLVPANAAPPYQTVVFYPGSGAIRIPEASPESMTPLLGNLVRSGRAVILPVLRGMYQRQDGLASTWPNETRAYVDYVRSWVEEFRRSIDYLESRPDIDTGKLAYYGASWGGRMGAIIAAVEPRLSTAILWSGGLASGAALPEVDQINYVTRVTMPVLMLNGPFDSIEPVEEAQLPMYRLLGTPPEHKRRVEIPGAGHALPDIPVTRESLAWLDQYLGPVN